MKERRLNIDHLTLSQIQERGLEAELNRPKRYKRGPGRPRQKLDKRNQFSLTYWFRIIEKDFKKLRPVQRCRIALDCWRTLLNKSNSIPMDPEESKMNADEVMGILKGIESKAINSESSSKDNANIEATPDLVEVKR